jgi:DNA polymerase III subunit epsilon
MTTENLTCQFSGGLPLSARLADVVFVAFDTETTGLSPVACHLVELSGVKFRLDGKELSTFQALIDPQVAIPAEATAVHGITNDMVDGQPGYETVVPDFMRWATAADEQQPPTGTNQSVLLAHNAPFDIGFLEVALGKLNLPMPENLVVDTLPLSRRLVSDSYNHKLRTLVEHLNIAASTYHRALADSYHVRNLFAHLVDQLPPDATVETLIELSGKLQFMDRTSAGGEGRWGNNQEFQAIKRAIANGNDLKIFYSGVRKSERRVTPLSVLFTGGNPYLSAFCHMASAERTFRIDRIVRMETLDKPR